MRHEAWRKTPTPRHPKMRFRDGKVLYTMYRCDCLLCSIHSKPKIPDKTEKIRCPGHLVFSANGFVGLL